MESLAEVRRVLVKVHQGAIECLVDLVWRRISVLLLLMLERWGHTITIPLRHKLVFKQGSKVASKESVHIHPYASIPPDYQQADQITIKPRLLVTAREQRAIFERRSPGECMHVRDAELERAWIAGDVACEQRVSREIAIGPHDKA